MLAPVFWGFTIPQGELLCSDIGAAQVLVIVLAGVGITHGEDDQGDDVIIDVLRHDDLGKIFLSVVDAIQPVGVDIGTDHLVFLVVVVAVQIDLNQGVAGDGQGPGVFFDISGVGVILDPFVIIEGEEVDILVLGDAVEVKVAGVEVPVLGSSVDGAVPAHDGLGLMRGLGKLDDAGGGLDGCGSLGGCGGIDGLRATGHQAECHNDGEEQGDDSFHSVFLTL